MHNNDNNNDNKNVNESDSCCQACVDDTDCVGWLMKSVGANDPWCMLASTGEVVGCTEEPCYPCGMVQRDAATVEMV